MEKGLLFYVLFGLMALFDTANGAEHWDETEIRNANTGANVNYLDVEEVLVIQYINLARLYPKKFVRIEITHFPVTGSYKASLIQYMNGIRPMLALTPRLDMSEDAKCFAKEMGESGYVGHNRVSCEKNFYSECCSYGRLSGRETAIDLLIDNNVPSLGHRKICLSPRSTMIGVASAPHTLHGICFVLELN